MTEGRHLSRLVLGILICLVLPLAGCDNGPSLRPLAPDAVILAFGDSLTYGTGGGENGSYPVQLAGLSGLKVINSGVPGEISRSGLVRLSQVLLEVQPQLVILCHGGNDMLRHMDRAELKSNLNGMIDLIRDSGADVILIGVPSPGLLPGPPPLYADLAKAWDIPYQGEVLAELLTDAEMKSDAVHPNAAGYRRMAEAILELMRKAKALAT